MRLSCTPRTRFPVFELRFVPEATLLTYFPPFYMTDHHDEPKTPHPVETPEMPKEDPKSDNKPM